ncbi:MAG: SBBP repeat-containing protein [Methylococcaceae bacterium]|nr:SBBP repeat-containing protein [Methylococcaceae bacterium]
MALRKQGKANASEEGKETALGISSSTVDKANPVDRTEEREKSEVLALRMKLLGAKPNPDISGLDELPGKVNYFTGSDPSKWRSGVSTYAKVRYASVYPGIDLVYYGNQRQLEYDFVVNPGADPNAIRLSFEGADQARVDENGDLVLTTPSGELRLHKPSIYQDINGQRRPVEGRFILHTPFSFAGNADSLTPSPLEGEGWDGGRSLPKPRSGAYDRRSTPTLTLPLPGGGDLCRYLCLAGGGQGGGRTPEPRAESRRLVAVSSALPPSHPSPCEGEGVDFSALSSLCGYPCLQGKVKNETAAILDSITGLPVEGMYSVSKQGLQVGFQIAAYDRDEPLTIDPVLVYSTYLGGSNYDFPYAIAVDSVGNAYVTGTTSSSDFPLVNAKYSKFNNRLNAFVFNLSADGRTVLYSTFIGSGYTFAYDIAVDGSGNAYVTGSAAFGAGYFDEFPTANAI